MIQEQVAGTPQRVFRGLDFKHAYQPLVDTRTRQVFGYEVLLRGPQQEPPWFLFERVNPSDRGLFERRINESALKHSQVLGNNKLLFINVSPSILLEDQGNYLLELTRLPESSFMATNIVLELSESGLQRDIRALGTTLNRLRGAGFTIALDDFGAGSAGLNSLIDVNPDIIKLDMHLIRAIHESGVRQALIRSVAQFADALGISILAEGVETNEEYYYLQGIGIHLFQGFLFARPKMDYLAKSFHHPLPSHQL